MNSKEQATPNPMGVLVIQTVAMPAHTNFNGDIFGGWLLSQMDMGAGIIATHRCKTRAATVAIESMVFLHPVSVGDTVCCYGNLLKVGRTSMKIKIEVWVRPRLRSDYQTKVTEGIFSFVAIDENGQPTPVDPE